jgi:ABC-2 type transport system permease protein
MWQRIIEIFRKEIRTVLREPRMRLMLFVPPVLQLIIFGFAVNLDVDTVKVAWTDSDGSAASRELLARFQGSGRFHVIATPKSGEELQRLLDYGAVQGGIRVLPGFSRDLKRGRTAGVQVLIEGTNSNTASLVASYASQILNAYSAEWAENQMNMRLLARSMSQPKELHLPEIIPETRVWFNPDLRSRYYFVPGVLVNIIMIVTVMLTALAIVREKEIGTMEQLMVTPIRPIELMIGKTLPFALVGLAQVVLITTVALLVFRVPFRGNALLLVLSSALFLMTTLGAGLFLSTISQTQQQAMMAMFFFTVPAFMLSGFAFPIANMPQAVQWLTFLNPARYFMEIVRGLFLKGAGLAALWPQMIALFVYGVSVLGLSAARFRKKLD